MDSLNVSISRTISSFNRLIDCMKKKLSKMKTNSNLCILNILWRYCVWFLGVTKIKTTQSILHAYLRGIWDSVKGVSLIFIVIRDTYSSSNALQNDKTTDSSEADESSTSSNATQTSKRSSKHRSTAANRRELNKLKE